MAAKCSKNTTFLLLIVFALFSDSNAIQGWGRLTEEEDLELDRKLQLLNKPAIKSFRTQHGDIIDCIDIYKQLAFDHPLLKNHTIQMKPKTISKGMKDEGSRTNVFPAYVASISCPPKSVPVKRTTKEDLIMYEHQKSTRSYLTNKLDGRGFHFAEMLVHTKSYGAKAAVNIWNPTVSTTQYSRAGIRIIQDSSEMFAGWQVYKWNYSRLYISWNDLDGYCNHHTCPGFVQVNHKIAIGSYLHPSTYNGHQYEIRISLSQDLTSGHWWFSLRDQHIGYWPREAFASFTEGGHTTSWGGQVYSPIGEASPAMGSGYFCATGYGKSAYFRGIKMITNKTLVFDDPQQDNTDLRVTNNDCYTACPKVSKDLQWGHQLFFGGPGGFYV